jgi:hypothetical protein
MLIVLEYLKQKMKCTFTINGMSSSKNIQWREKFGASMFTKDGELWGYMNLNLRHITLTN